MSLHPVVATHVAVQLTKSAERVAKLEAALRTVPVNTGRTWVSVNVSKRLTEERAQLASWRLLTLADGVDVCPHDCDGCHGDSCPCERFGCNGYKDKGATA